MTLEIELAELMTTDVMSTTLVSVRDGLMTFPLSMEALLDEAVEVVVDDGFEEPGLVVEIVRVF